MPPLNPKIQGICDSCGGNLIIREDDNYDTIKSRLDVYKDSTADLEKFYTDQGKMLRFRAPKGKADYPNLLEEVKQRLNI